MDAQSEHEELAANPLFSALQSREPLMRDIAANGSLVCVPASESLKLCKLTSDFIDTHILTASPHFADRTRLSSHELER